MTGPRQAVQTALFHGVSLEDQVPQDHLLRSIDRFVDLGSIRAHPMDFYSHAGRPSVDPELLIRMLLGGLLLRYPVGAAAVRGGSSEPGVSLVLPPRSERPCPGSPDILQQQACVARQAIARHSAERGRFRESDLLRHVFETTVARCMEEGLVGGQGFAVDASSIVADVQKQSSSTPEDRAAREIDGNAAARAVREDLDTLDDAAFAAATAAKPRVTAPADPASQWLSADCPAIACR